MISRIASGEDQFIQRHRALHPTHRVALPLLFGAILLLRGTAAAAAEPATAPTQLRESAVRQARAGDSQDALRILKDLVQRYPEDPRLLSDCMIVAGWAGDDAYVLSLYGQTQVLEKDWGATEAAARSARNLHRYGLALDLFRRAETLAPERWEPRLGSAMVLTDQGNLAAAASLMKPLLRNEGNEPDVERGEAYLCSRQQDYACTIAMDQQLLSQSHGDTDGLRCEIARSLSQLGADTLARGMCSPADVGDQLRLLAAAGAERVRWSEAIDHDWQQRKNNAEQALSMLDQAIAGAHSGDGVWTQAQSDRLLALYDLFRMQEVIQSWQHLRQLQVKVPDYALARVAGAYLTLHRPQEAATLYRSLVQRAPEDGDLWSGLAYAEFESEHIRQSFSTVDQAYENTPAWLQSPGLKVPESNRFHADLALQAAQMRGYAGMPAREQERLSSLLAMGPADPKLGRAMALTYLARGWPLRAIREERIADSFEQNTDLPVLEDVEVLEGAGRREEVDALLGRLLQREGRSPAVVRFLDDRAAERGWQATVTSGYEWSSGRYLGNSQHSEGYLSSPYVDDRWRIYLHGLGDSGQFVEGSAYRSRAALGFRYDYNRQSFWAEGAADTRNAGAIAAGAGGVQFSMGDHWIVGADGDSDNMSDLQLIAQLAGVRARSGLLHLEWRQSESSAVRFNLQRMLFSDGNQRATLTALWEQRVLTVPRLQIDLSPQVWSSTNSRDQNRLYFNPERDLSVGSGVDLRWISWRHYDRSLVQEFIANAAPYWQENYGTHAAVSGAYTQIWKMSRRLGLTGRFSWHGQPYDGSRQPYSDLSFGLTWGDQ